MVGLYVDYLHCNSPAVKVQVTQTTLLTLRERRDTVDQERLGERLRKAREQARLNQSDAAQALRLTPAALNQYESGKRRVDALMLDRLSRLYGVPIRFFFGGETSRADWEEALLLRADGLSPESRAGISRLIEKVHALEELYRRTGVSFPTPAHPPFGPLAEAMFSHDEVALWADKARRHFDLGVAPLADLSRFLETQGYQVFTISFGEGEGHLSGLFFLHPDLGPIVAVNEDQAYTRRPFTLAHEFAHGLYHYDRLAILCRTRDPRPMELFADRFAAHFLVPTEALRERLRDLRLQTVRRPEDVVHLARFFGVSYQSMLQRLESERLLARPRDAFVTRPVTLAHALGYAVSPYEFGTRPLPVEERLPRVFLELAYQAVSEKKLSLRRVAEMLGVSNLELDERLNPQMVEEPVEVYA
jgi:Zn-dependent peptidase ImmA (M78 family)/transcriptional regulator with XRE-family HTH domain